MTGSNIFGSRLTDRQTFTGSINATGSNHAIFGNVGIGTASPISTAGYTFTTTDSPVGSGYITRVNAATALYVYSNATDSRVAEQRALPLIFETSGTQRVSINAAGSSSFTANVLASAADAATINLKQNSTTANTGIYLERSGEQKGYYIYMGGSVDSLTFQRNNGGTKGDVMALTRDGNVGIGTTSPSQKLEVVGGEIKAGRVDSSNEGGQLSFGRASDNNTAWYIDAYGNAASPQLRFVDVDNSAVRMTLTGSNVGIGTSSPSYKFEVNGISASTSGFLVSSGQYTSISGVPYIGMFATEAGSSDGFGALLISSRTDAARPIIFGTSNGSVSTERMRITSGGSVLFQKTAANNTDTGVVWFPNDYFCVTNNSADSGDRVVLINRENSDGTLIDFRHANVTEGSISVAGTTVSYNGGHLSRYSQTELDEKIEGLLKGTVMSNLDKMAVWINPETEEPYENEQLNCMKISDVEGDKNVAGVFVNWQYDSELLTNDMNIAMTGDMIIRIAQGVVVEKGQLLMSAGDGTAKPQEDDIIRSKTIAKVTSNHITCVYEDGSYCVPCVLMAC